MGTITVDTRKRFRPRQHRFANFRDRVRKRRLQRAERAYSMRMNRTSARSLPGSEHAHLLRHKGF